MTEKQNLAIELIEKQQAKLKEGQASWVVGQQLKEICRHEADAAELLAEDLRNDAMSIVQAEKKIKEYADKHKTGNFSFVSPQKAEEILRKFYALPARGEEKNVPEKAVEAPQIGQVIDLGDFL